LDCSNNSPLKLKAGFNLSPSNTSTPSQLYKISVSVTQLNANQFIILQNNSTDDLEISSNGSYNFSKSMEINSSYLVNIFTQPTNQNCVISNGYGLLTSNVTINVVCTGNSYGPLYNGTIFNPLSQTGSGVTTFVGSPCNPNTSGCTSTPSYVDSPGVVAFNNPDGLITDGTNLYIADRLNHMIRKIVLSSGYTTTIAGNGSAGIVDGTGTSASLDNPRYLATDGIDIYIADSTNDAIRKVNISTNQVTTLIKNNPNFDDPKGMIIKNNSIYFLENASSSLKQYDMTNGNLTTYLTGLSTPGGITIVGNTLYIVETAGHRIISTTIGVWTTTILAGTGISGYVNSPSTVQFNSPERITTDGTNLYISEVGNNTIRKLILSTNSVSTYAGPNTCCISGYTNSSTYSNALFNFPRGLTSDGQSLYVADRNNNAIRKIF
jgi:hypothetical protein